MLAGMAGRAGHLGDGPAEAGRGSRLRHARDLDEGLAFDVVRMLGGLAHGQHGAKHTSVPSISSHHSSRVFVRNSCSSRPLSTATGPGPSAAQLGITLEPGQPQELGVELRFDRADRDVAAVLAAVDVVEVGTVSSRFSPRLVSSNTPMLRMARTSSS